MGQLCSNGIISIYYIDTGELIKTENIIPPHGEVGIYSIYLNGKRLVYKRDFLSTPSWYWAPPGYEKTARELIESCQ
jgi:hypothetical protein